MPRVQVGYKIGDLMRRSFRWTTSRWMGRESQVHGNGNQELERLCIVWDILIDEERYTELSVCKDREPILTLPALLSDTTSILRKCENTINPNTASSVVNIDVAINDNGDVISFPGVSPYWLPLCLARNARAILQSEWTSEAEKALDEVAEYLLTRLPDLPPTTDRDNDQVKEAVKEAKAFRTLYYNEVSQCYLGYLASGYAEKALELWKPEATPYELLGLYNKALQLFHHENHEDRLKAIEYLDEIINEFERDNPLAVYVEKGLGLGFFDKEFDKEMDPRLWKYYVYYPALLNKCEVLLKLQRGEECQRLAQSFLNAEGTCRKREWRAQFDSTHIPLLRNYMELRAKFLWLSAEIDSSGICLTIEGKSDVNALREKVSELMKDEMTGQCPNLKRAFELLSMRIILELDYDVPRIVCALKGCEKRIPEETTKEDKAEVILLWLKGLNRLLNLDHQKIDDLNIGDVLSRAVKLLDPSEDSGEQKKWLPLRGEIIQQLDNALAKSRKFGWDRSKVARDFYKALCSGYGRRQPSQAMRLKYKRRIKLLPGHCTTNPDEDESEFPTDDHLERVINFTKERLNRDFYFQRLFANTASFDDHLVFKSHWPQLAGSYAFTVLRKWQSFTPSLASYSKDSRGGGYFFCYVNGRGEVEDGIVIDPGYDFLQNFFEHGFSMADISTVVFTHFHIDHTADFRTMVTLIHEMNKRGRSTKGENWQNKKLQVMATKSCFEHFYSTFTDSKDCIKDVVLLSSEEQTPLKIGGSFSIQPIPAYHQDLGESDCAGLVISARGKQLHRPILGMTGDTVWARTLVQYLKECAVVFMNMGALIDVRKGDSFEKVFANPQAVKELIYEQNHLYLPGTVTLLQELLEKRQTQLAVIGELGEELKSGLREDFFYAINDFLVGLDASQGRTPFKALMEDVGLTITWESGSGKPQVRCARCKQPIPDAKIRLKVAEDNRQSEQLYYYCPACAAKVEWSEKGDDEMWRRRYWPRPAR